MTAREHSSMGGTILYYNITFSGCDVPSDMYLKSSKIRKCFTVICGNKGLSGCPDKVLSFTANLKTNLKTVLISSMYAKLGELEM